MRAQRYIMRQLQTNRRLGLKQTDERLKMVGEVMSGIHPSVIPPPHIYPGCP